MDRTVVRIVDGAFAGFEGAVVSVDGDVVSLRVSMFGRETPVEVRRDQVERPVGTVEPAEADRAAVARLRDRVVEQHDDLAYLERIAFFLERADLPESDAAAEWDAYVIYGAGVDARVEQLRSTALDRFDSQVAPLPAEEAVAQIEADPAFWLPANIVRERLRVRYPEPDDPGLEARMLAELAGEPRPPARDDRARDRRVRARSAADLRDYTAWKTSAQSPQQCTQARLDAVATVQRERRVVQERFARDWGVELPEAIFRFWAFLLACGPMQRQALDDIELKPFGIMDLFDAPTCSTRDGIDVRVHGRYYRDPPEFLTFMHGGSDGLHFGLWYDDGRTCDGVASYYNNDGGGVGLPAGTPLEAVRATLERYWRDCPDYFGEVDDEAKPYSPRLAERRHRFRLLRELLMTFETGDRPEEGEAYSEAGPAVRSVLQHGHPDRIETLDGGGALVPGETAIARKRQKPYDDYEFCTNLQNELTEDAVALEAHVAEARRRCAAGNPADALTLGRDLHWISGGDMTRERYANELLVVAYQAIGRPNLAGIAEAHHRHRGLPRVDVLPDHAERSRP